MCEKRLKETHTPPPLQILESRSFATNFSSSNVVLVWKRERERERSSHVKRMRREEKEHILHLTILNIDNNDNDNDKRLINMMIIKKGSVVKMGAHGSLSLSLSSVVVFDGWWMVDDDVASWKQQRQLNAFIIHHPQPSLSSSFIHSSIHPSIKPHSLPSLPFRVLLCRGQKGVIISWDIILGGQKRRIKKKKNRRKKKAPHLLFYSSCMVPCSSSSSTPSGPPGTSLEWWLNQISLFWGCVQRRNGTTV